MESSNCDLDLVEQAAVSLGFTSLKPEQNRAILYFLSGKDVFVSLPTGYGKSLCYALLPRLFDLKRHGSIDCHKSYVVVVSPLIALMKDQVSSFSEKGLTACCITHETTAEEKRKAREGQFQLLFFSPESLLISSRWRGTLQSEPYTSNVVAFVVDEAHCVKQW